MGGFNLGTTTCFGIQANLLNFLASLRAKSVEAEEQLLERRVFPEAALVAERYILGNRPVPKLEIITWRHRPKYSGLKTTGSE